MYVQLTVDIGGTDPRAIAKMVDTIGPVTAHAAAAGHKVSLEVVDSIGPYDPEDSPTQAEARGYGSGFGAGFQKGYDAAAQALAVRTFGGPVSIRAEEATLVADPGAAAAALRWADIGRQVADGLSQGAESLASGVFAHYTPPAPVDPTPPTEPVNGYGFPDSMPATYTQELASGPALLTTDADATPTATNLPMYVDFPPPPGDRPGVGPGAPISAYDRMSASSAVEAYGFPDAHNPNAPLEHIDSEGARWAYIGDNQWQRLTWPAKWGSAPAGEFPSIHLPDGI